MPRATVSQDTTRIDLESCPGGYIVVRALPFGLKLARREQATRMSMEQEVNRGRRNRDRKDTQKVNLELLQRWSAQYDFEHCIVEHNLEDDNGAPLDFSNSMTLDVLDPRIGEEIERHISRINGEGIDEEDLEDFTRSAFGSSAEEARKNSLNETTNEN